VEAVQRQSENNNVNEHRVREGGSEGVRESLCEAVLNSKKKKGSAVSSQDGTSS
jgi:hypothetical protein